MTQPGTGDEDMYRLRRLIKGDPETQYANFQCEATKGRPGGFSVCKAISTLIVLAIVMVPAVDMLSSVLGADDMKRNERVVLYAQEKLDDVRARLENDPDIPVIRSGNLSKVGQAYYCYYIVIGQLRSIAGVAAQGIAVTVWFDGDLDGVIGIDEECATLYAVADET